MLNISVNTSNDDDASTTLPHSSNKMKNLLLECQNRYLVNVIADVRIPRPALSPVLALDNGIIVPYNQMMKKKFDADTIPIQKQQVMIENVQNTYTYEALNAEQRKIFNYVVHNHRKITLVQAGPGTGKTFTMRTIAHALLRGGDAFAYNRSNAVIYKNDLVNVYNFCSYGYSLAKFIMRIFSLNYKEYQALERNLSSPISLEYFIATVIQLFNSIKLTGDDDDFYNNLLILDEYTVIPKPLLLIVMLALHRYKIGAVICGDRNQLQNIHNSKHAGAYAAYDIVKHFAHQEFQLDRNERCSDIMYNGKVQLLSEFSSSEKLKDWGSALVGAIFYKNLVRLVDIEKDTILAVNHIDISELVHTSVYAKDEYLKEPWLIESTSPTFVQGTPIEDNGTLFYPKPLISFAAAIEMVPDKKSVQTSAMSRVSRYVCPGKFLPYLPLIVNQTYFVYMLTERLLGTLIGFTPDHQNGLKSVMVRMHDTNRTVILFKRHCSKVVFEKHENYLLNSGHDELWGRSTYGSGKLYNFPLYPAFTMSIYMSQGRTISSNVSFIFNNATFQSLYVAASRITREDNVNSVAIENASSLLLSTLMNFDLCSSLQLTAEQIHAKLVEPNGRYLQYRVPFVYQSHFDCLMTKLVLSEDSAVRTEAMTGIRELVNKYQLQGSLLPPYQMNTTTDVGSDRVLMITLEFILNFETTIMALSQVDELYERHLWLRVLLKRVAPSMLDEKNIIKFTNNYDLTCKTIASTCTFNRQNLLINQSVKEFILDRALLCMSDKNGKFRDPKRVAINDECQLVPTIKPNTQYNCVSSFAQQLCRLAYTSNMNDATFCRKMYKLLSSRISTTTTTTTN